MLEVDREWSLQASPSGYQGPDDRSDLVAAMSVETDSTKKMAAAWQTEAEAKAEVEAEVKVRVEVSLEPALDAKASCLCTGRNGVLSAAGGQE